MMAIAIECVMTTVAITGDSKVIVTRIVKGIWGLQPFLQ